MYKLCKTEQSARRQRQLEEGLQELMRQKPYDEINVVDLCEYLQIPRKSFYRYFSSKEGALHALIDHTLLGFENYIPVIGHDAPRSPSRELTYFFLFWIEQKDLLDALAKSGISGALVERAMSHAINEYNLPHRFLPDDSPDTRKQIILFCVTGLMSMVLTWHHFGYQKSAEEMASIALRILSHPLFPDVEQLL
jgi:AcrR family transcriptional regulator